MNVAIPAEFESFAREQVRSGAVASEEEAVAVALRHYLTHIEDLRTLLGPALAEADRGEGVEGDAFLETLIEETRLRLAG